LVDRAGRLHLVFGLSGGRPLSAKNQQMGIWLRGHLIGCRDGGWCSMRTELRPAYRPHLAGGFMVGCGAGRSRCRRLRGNDVANHRCAFGSPGERRSGGRATVAPSLCLDDGAGRRIHCPLWLAAKGRNGAGPGQRRNQRKHVCQLRLLGRRRIVFEPGYTVVICAVFQRPVGKKLASVGRQKRVVDLRRGHVREPLASHDGHCHCDPRRTWRLGLAKTWASCHAANRSVALSSRSNYFADDDHGRLGRRGCVVAALGAVSG